MTRGERPALRALRVRVAREARAVVRADRYATGLIDAGEGEAADVVRHVVRTRRVLLLEMQGNLAALRAGQLGASVPDDA